MVKKQKKLYKHGRKHISSIIKNKMRIGKKQRKEEMIKYFDNKEYINNNINKKNHKFKNKVRKRKKIKKIYIKKKYLLFRILVFEKSNKELRKAQKLKKLLNKLLKERNRQLRIDNELLLLSNYGCSNSRVYLR